MYKLDLEKQPVETLEKKFIRASGEIIAMEVEKRLREILNYIDSNPNGLSELISKAKNFKEKP